MSFGCLTARHAGAIHVRHGDKITELKQHQAGFPGSDNREGFNHSGSEYTAKAKELGKIAGVDIRTIFVMSGVLPEFHL